MGSPVWRRDEFEGAARDLTRRVAAYLEASRDVFRETCDEARADVLLRADEALDGARMRVDLLVLEELLEECGSPEGTVRLFTRNRSKGGHHDAPPPV